MTEWWVTDAKIPFLAGGEHVLNWTGAAGTVIGNCSDEINPD